MPDDEPDYKNPGEKPPYDEYEEQIIKKAKPWEPYEPRKEKSKNIVHPDGVVTD